MNKLLKNNKINIFIVFLIAVLFFYKATKVYFVADDFFYLVNRNNFDLYSPFTYFFYQPITFLIYWINYFWAGQSASNYHFFTIILNGINLCLSYYLIYLILDNKVYAFFITLFGTVFYVAADNMIWINCTNNVICAFFYFLTLIFSVKYNLQKNRINLFLMFLFMNLCLYSREMGVTIFISAVFIDIIFFVKDFTKKELNFYLKKHVFSILSGFFYIFVMALGPSFRYGKLTFNRGAYELVFDIKEMIINSNWFFFRLVFPVSFRSHFSIPWLHKILFFLRANNLMILIMVILCFFVRNKKFYFGFFWVLITVSPYLLLDKYLVHTGERYFYMPRFMFAFCFIGIFETIKSYLPKKINELLKCCFFIILLLYICGSFYAIQKRIGWWIQAGNTSKNFLNAFRNKYNKIPKKTLFFIKDVPRWAENSPNKLIVLVTGTTYALRLYYNDNTLKVSNYWEDDLKESYNRIPDKNIFNNFIFLKYENSELKDWIPPDKYVDKINEKLAMNLK